MHVRNMPRRMLVTAVCAFTFGMPAWSADHSASASGVQLPRRSDVVVSPRFLRPESAQIVEAYGATRIEWVYTANAAATAVLARLPPGVGRTLNANPPLPSENGLALDFDGKPIAVPWLKSQNINWVTTTHPDTRKALSDQLEQLLASQPLSIQVDDPLLQYFSANSQGGDFNPATQAGFRDWLQRKADPARVRAAGLNDYDGDYRRFLVQRHAVRNVDDYVQRFRQFPSTPLWLDYIRSTVEDYMRGVRERARQAHPPAAISMNLAGLAWPDARQSHFFLSAFADYVLAETPIADTDELIARANTVRSLGLGFVASLKPADLPRNRVAIATLYALGAQPVVPWDVFVPDQPRFFGSVLDYGDLYRFVRRNSSLLDGYDEAPLVGIVVDPKSFPTSAVKELVQRLGERQIPYEFLLVGPDLPPRAAFDRKAVARLKLLVMGVSDAQLDAGQRLVLQGASAPRSPLDRVPTSQLDALRPAVVAPGAGRVRIYIRENATRPGEWVAHVIDEDRGGARGTEQTAPCSRRVGLSTGTRDRPIPERAVWVTPAGRTELVADKGAGIQYFNLPDCPVWGMLAFSSDRP